MSIISIEEANDHQLDDNMDIFGKERSYLCVFCKRGFTTAQALGGHMNIHRKDRAKPPSTNKPSTIIKQDQESNINNLYSVPPFYDHPISSYDPWYATTQGAAPIHYQSYFPASTSSTYDQTSIHTFPFGGDHCCMSLSLQFGTAKYEEDMEKKRTSESEDDGLDLELRLGYDP